MSTDPQHRRPGEEGDDHGGSDGGVDERAMYLRFGAMIATSTLVMFVLTYTNSYALDHVRFSEERLYMALVMGAAMAVVMLAFMVGMMYRNTKINLAITEMDWLVEDIEENGAATTQAEAGERPVPDFGATP